MPKFNKDVIKHFIKKEIEQHINCYTTKQEGKEYIDGMLTMLWFLTDDNIYEDISKEIADYVEQKYDVYIDTL